jgi:hypothetical protein
MEEIQSEAPPAVVAESSPEAPAKQTWKEWLGTDAAVRWVYLIFGFCAIVMLMVMLQFSTDAICCGDWDGYYHIRWSSLLWESFRQGHWLPAFTWLPLTVLNTQDYADHHFLFHLLQIPFLWFFEPVMAAKVAAVVYSSLALFSVYWLLFRYGIDYLLIWFGALLTCANPFFYRMSMAKAPPLTIIITIIGIYLLFERKYIYLLPLMFLFVWTYSLFPLLLFAAVFWVLIIGWNERRVEWRPLAYTVGGLILGNLINPYFPQNLWLFYEHFAEKIKIGTDFAVPVGGEWYPYSGQELLTHFPIALAAMLIGYILFAPKNKKLPEKATFFLMFVTVLLAAQFRSKRFAEYFPPFAILFAAFSWQAFKTAARVELPEDFRREIEPYLDKVKDAKKTAEWRRIKGLLHVALGLFFVMIMVYDFRGVDMPFIHQQGLITDIKENEKNDKYRRAMDWISNNVPPGEIIFNCNWDDFPKMFFLDTKHAYTYGLDPNYLYTKNPDLYKLIPDITGGKIDDPAPVIREKFNSRIIFSDAKENEDFLAKALESGWCEIAYDDDEAIILKIRDEKGEPPPNSLKNNRIPAGMEKIDDNEAPANDEEDNE